jgi:hypothetical protein
MKILTIRKSYRYKRKKQQKMVCDMQPEATFPIPMNAMTNASCSGLRKTKLEAHNAARVRRLGGSEVIKTALLQGIDRATVLERSKARARPNRQLGSEIIRGRKLATKMDAAGF